MRVHAGPNLELAVRIARRIDQSPLVYSSRSVACKSPRQTASHNAPPPIRGCDVARGGGRVKPRICSENSPSCRQVVVPSASGILGSSASAADRVGARSAARKRLAMNGDWVPAGPFDSWDRRSFLIASGSAVSGWAARRGEASTPAAGATARSTILFFLCGGASHIDMWDMKPEAPAEYRGVFQPIATTAPAIRLCEHLPLTARQAHRLAVVNSVGASVNTNDHHAGYYNNLTGRAPDESFLTLGNSRTPMLDDWPFMGSVIAARRPNRNGLPNAVTLPHKPSKAPYTRPGQFAGKLGAEYDPFYVSGNRETPAEFRAPSLAPRGELTADRMLDRRGLLQVVDGARRTAERFAPPSGLAQAPGARLFAPDVVRNDAGVRPVGRIAGPARSVRAHDQRHVPSGGEASGRSRRPVCDRLLEGRRKTHRQVQERRGMGYARRQLQLPKGRPAAGVRSVLFRVDRGPGPPRTVGDDPRPRDQ